MTTVDIFTLDSHFHTHSNACSFKFVMIVQDRHSFSSISTSQPSWRLSWFALIQMESTWFKVVGEASSHVGSQYSKEGLICEANSL